MRRLLQALAHANVVIAISALSLTYATGVYAGFPASPAVLALSFFATWLVYTVDRVAPFSPEDEINAPDRTRFVRAHRRALVVGAVVSAIVCAACVPFLHVASFVVGGALGLVVVVYGAPIVPTVAAGGPLRWRRGKDFPITKPMLVALVWSVSTVVVPALEAGHRLDDVLVFVAAYRFLFVLAATLAFELRDVGGDKSGFPHVVGEARTLWIARGCLIVAGASAVAGIVATRTTAWMLLPVLVVPALLVLLRNRDRLRDETYLGVWVDGALAIPGACAFAAHMLGHPAGPAVRDVLTRAG